VGTVGADTNSTSPQSDFYVLEIEKMKLAAAGSGNDEAWIPGRDEFYYTTPRDLASLAGARRPRGVWVQQLMFYHPQGNRDHPGHHQQPAAERLWKIAAQPDALTSFKYLFNFFG